MGLTSKLFGRRKAEAPIDGDTRPDDDTATASNFNDDDSAMEIDSPNTSPEQVLSLKVTPKHDSIGIDAHDMVETQVCATLTACDIPDSARSPIDLVVVLDISGSMSGNKLQLCKETLELLIRVLQANDRFGLVVYGSHATVKVPIQAMTAQNKEQALATIRAIRTSGMTNLSGGLSLAAQEIKLIVNPNQVQSIFLLTDGHANEGITSQEGLVELTKSIQRTAGAGGASAKDEFVYVNAQIPVHCFGYGSDHNSTILREISNASGGGSYYFVDNDSNVKEAFGDAMGGMLSVVAQSTVVKISVPSHAAELGVKINKVHHKEALRREDGSYTVSIGDFYAEESRDVLLNVELPKIVEDDESETIPLYIPLVEVSASYTSVVETNCGIVNSDPVTCFLSRPEGAEVSKANAHVMTQWLRIFVAQEIEQASQEGDRNQLEVARNRLKEALVTVRKESQGWGESNDLIQSMIRDIELVQDGFASTRQYQAAGGHYAKSRAKGYEYQRQSAPASYCMDDSISMAYRSAKKMNMARKFKG